jgi:DNA invertase Pin-like site-specific DNA recombinase
MTTSLLRFGALVRVSTELKEKTGESLHVQRAKIEQDIELLRGIIAEGCWYGGQEHATPGYQKKEIDRLIADAGKGKFDAVIATHSDRLFRDNVKKEQMKVAFKTHGIRLFVGVTEYDLSNPEHGLFLDMASAIGQYQAANQKKKSLLSKLSRARKGMPSANQKVPFGRTFRWARDRQAGEWAIDADKKAMVEDVARRYLAGESLPKLAAEYNIQHASLATILRKHSGSEWIVHFHSDEFRIDEEITIPVPSLLDEKTIRGVQQRLVANRTYLHKPPRSVHNYLLSSHVFCCVCGGSLIGQIDAKGYKYYAHAYGKRLKDCPLRPRPWVPAAKLEGQVIRQLFGMFGNPTAIERAIKAAIPDADKAIERQRKLEEDLSSIERSRARILGLVVKDAITEKQAEKELHDLKARERILREQLEQLSNTLADVPDEKALRCYVERFEDAFGDTFYKVDEQGNHTPCKTQLIAVYDNSGEPGCLPGGNDVHTFCYNFPDEDKRRLVATVFDGPLGDGTPAGVYVMPAGESLPYRPKQWSFTIRGKLEFQFMVPSSSQTSTTSRAAAPW